MTGSARALDARWFGLWSILALLAVAIVTRAAVFGNAAYSGDDQYYLLVGKAIDHGQLPYVDIWDRKPIGLFMIYAAIARLGGSGVEQYQLVAGLFAVATAWVVTRLASRIANRQGGLLAGVVYLATLVPFGGQGGPEGLDLLRIKRVVHGTGGLDRLGDLTGVVVGLGARRSGIGRLVIKMQGTAAGEGADQAEGGQPSHRHPHKVLLLRC